MFSKHLVLGAVIAGVVNLFSPSSAVAANLNLWTRAYASSGKCSSVARATGPEAFSRSVTGFSWPLPKGSGVEFLDRTIMHLNAAATGRGKPAVLKARLMAAAQTGAYTELDFGARGGSSPAFVSSVMVMSISHAVSYLRGKGAISASELKTLNSWVAKLMRNMTQKASSIDHKASIGAARLAWGAATGDASLYKKGLSQVSSVLGKLRSNPYFDKKVRVNTEVLPIVLMAAHIARLNGTDLFGKKYGKRTLHDAVSFHAAWVSQTGTKKVRTIAIADSEARSIMRATGWGTHQAWIPVYLAHFPKSHAAAEVRVLHKKVKRAQNTAYYGRNMGIHSACYFGF